MNSTQKLELLTPQEITYPNVDIDMQNPCCKAKVSKKFWIIMKDNRTPKTTSHALKPPSGKSISSSVLSSDFSTGRSKDSEFVEFLGCALEDSVCSEIAMDDFSSIVVCRAGGQEGIRATEKREMIVNNL